jgi:hypothetical protein
MAVWEQAIGKQREQDEFGKGEEFVARKCEALTSLNLELVIALLSQRVKALPQIERYVLVGAHCFR